jgi:hypothetical protein
MTDYVTLRNRIIDELANDGALTTAQVNYAIADAIKFYERRNWWWNQKTATLSTVAAQEYYSSTDLADIPDIVQIISATVTHDGLKSPLRMVDYQTIDDTQDGSVTTLPAALAVFKENIRLYPIPDAAYTVTLSYVYRLTALSDDADSNAWTTDAEELIRQSAKRRIALNYFHAEDVAARCAVMEKEAFDELLAENRRRLPNTTLRVPSMLERHSFNINSGQ